MNEKEKMIFQQDVEVPPIVMEKAQAAFLTIEKEGQNMMKESKSVKMGRIVKTTAAAAACAALLVAAAAAGKGMLPGKNDDLAAVGAAGAEQDGGLAVVGEADAEQGADLSVAMNEVEGTAGHVSGEDSGFALTTYAPEARLSGAQDGSLALTDIGCGEGGYTGMLFQVKGSDIADVSISLDKGELYTATIGELSADDFQELAAQGLPDEDGDPDTHTVYQLSGDPFAGEDAGELPDKITAYYCTKSGAKVTGKYDGELYYGFYIPDDVVSSKEDLAEAHREQLGVFDESTLTVTVTRTDGSSVTKEYGLSVAKLALDEERNVTQQEWIEGGEGFVYGVLVKEK